MPAVKKIAAAGWISAVLDTILPPRCPGTGEIVEAPGTVSPAFWPQLSFIETPFCSTCGIPFSYDIAEGALCAACIDYAPAFDCARAALTYNDASRKLVVDFKHDDRLHTLPAFTTWLERAGQDLIAACDVIVPVPLHRWRLWQRRFNQSARLAQALSKRTGKPWLADALRRTRHTPKQKGLSRKERAANVRGAFKVNPAQSVAGKNVLLIDDVFTSGATLNECAKIMKKAGANEVLVLTIARVTKDEL